MRVATWVAVAALVFAVSAARAEDPIGRISLGGSGGLSTYALSDVNERIDAGNRFLADERDWTTVDPLRRGWTFWADLKLPVPMLDFLFVTGGYGVSSGSSTGPDYNELITTSVSQEAYHARVLYLLPFRPQEDTRLFAGGGPLFIQKQEVRTLHTRRSSAGGTSGTEMSERTEEVYFNGQGLGWQFGVAAEYMLQDYMTLAIDLGYRWAGLDQEDWSAERNVIIEDTDPAEFIEDGTSGLDRLDRDHSYILNSFLDRRATEERELQVAGRLHQYGPHRSHMMPVAPADLGIDLSGLQVHLGVRFYFL